MHRHRMGGRGTMRAAALLAFLLPQASGQEDLDRLEHIATRVSERLTELRGALETQVAGNLDPDLLSTPLLISGPPSEVTQTWGQPSLALSSVQRTSPAPAEDPIQALTRTFETWLGLDGRQLELKVIAVEEGPEGIRSTLLVHGSGHTDDLVRQVNARWTMTWLDTEGEPLRLRTLQVSGEEWLDAQAPLFREVTGAVLDPESGRSRLLQWGCDTWVRRTDHVGESNWFGHNGTALGDVNGDGLEDLYVGTGTGTPNLLLVRRPDGSLEERGAEAGVAWLDDTKGVLLLDFDQDGDRDILAAIGPAIVLSANDGEGHFTTASSLQAETASSFYSLAAADYDLDGDLDVAALRYVQTAYGQSIPRPFQDARNGPRNHLLRNDGAGVFTDVTAEAGLDHNNDRFSLAASWADYDGDGDPDLYVANDFGRNNLYRNDAGRFIDVAAELGVEDQAAGMGVSWSDFDRDGDLDLHVSNMFSSAGLRVAYNPSFRGGASKESIAQAQRHAQGNSLFVNEGGRFRETGGLAGIRMGRWAWGGRFTDLNGDGLDDLVVPNGFMTNEAEDDL